MRNMHRDLSLATRVLIKSPGFTMASVLTLALGIGANTAIFSLADATLLRPLDVERPEQLVAFSWSSSYPHYQAYTQRNDIFEGVIAVGGTDRLSISVAGASELASAAFVSGNTFEILGVTPAIGRMLQPADDIPNGPVVAVLGHDYWRTHFGGRVDVVGRSLSINGRPVTVVGVARRGFRGTTLFANPAVYVPLTSSTQLRTGLFSRAPVLTSPGFVWLTVIGRLRNGVPVAQAGSAMSTLYEELQPLRDGERREGLVLEPMTMRALGSSAASVRQFVLLLAGVVCLTLLIACANLANLLLARAAARRREVGVRLALGAGRGHVIRQMLAESLLLSLVGGVLGLAVAAVALRVLGGYELPGGLGIEGLGVEMNREALLLTGGLSIVTGLLFGGAPAWRASRTDVMVSLRDGTRGASARSGLRSALVSAQVALSLVLLTGSGLFVRSLVQAMNVPLGFQPAGVAMASVNLNLVRYDQARSREFYDAH
jgi:predicted permease